MKNYSCLFLLLFSTIILSQKKIYKTYETNLKELNINSSGLDDLILINSDSKFVKVYLEAEEYDEQLIKFDEKNESLEISFYFEGRETREVIFRKYITKRLQRANAIIEIPENMKVSVFGENVDIESKNLKSELLISIDNGIVKLNTILKNTSVKLYAGNVYGNKQNNNISVSSNLGKIEIDGAQFVKKFRSDKNSSINKLLIESIKANIFLTTE